MVLLCKTAPPPNNGIGEGEFQVTLITNASSASDLETVSNSEVTKTEMLELEAQECET